MYLQLGLKLAIKHTSKTDTSWNTKWLPFAEQLDLEELFRKLRVGASISNALPDFLPIWQFLILKNDRFCPVRHHILGLKVELQLWVNCHGLEAVL